MIFPLFEIIYGNSINLEFDKDIKYKFPSNEKLYKPVEWSKPFSKNHKGKIINLLYNPFVDKESIRNSYLLKELEFVSKTNLPSLR